MRIVSYSMTLFTAIFIFISCAKEDNEILPTIENELDDSPGTQTVLGEKLNIPYTVTNMQKAYNNLRSNNSLKTMSFYSAMSDLTIEASHYYYRFLPKDSLEYEELVNDTILDVSDVPLDYDITINGDYYKDSTITDSPFTYLYSVFPVDYCFSYDITNEKLADLYFPPETESSSLAEGEIIVKQSLNSTSKKLLDNFSDVFFNLWEYEAFRISNNLSESELETINYITLDNDTLTYSQIKSINCTDITPNYQALNDNIQLLSSKWNPYGEITVEEDKLTDLNSANNIIGVEGALVKVRKWGLVVIKKTRTSSDGSFKTSSTRTKKVKYSVYFDGILFNVKAGNFYQDARHRGTHMYNKEGWYQCFEDGGTTHFYALIHNAAYDYYYRVVNEYGLSMPGISKICGKYSSTNSSQYRAKVITALGLVSDIRITGKSNSGNYKSSDNIYASTVHELTHAGHREMDTGMFSVLESGSTNRLFLCESWAEGVETIVTNDRYENLDKNKYFNSANYYLGWNYGKQKEGVSDMDEYTPIVVDLVDDFNQNIKWSSAPVDSVSNYSLEQIQNALDNCRTITNWENNLRSNYNNATEDHLTQLFDYMRKVRNNY